MFRFAIVSNTNFKLGLFNFCNIFYASEDLLLYTAHQNIVQTSQCRLIRFCAPVLNVKSKCLSEQFPSVQLTGKETAHLSSNF